MSLLTSPAICFKCGALKIGPIIVCRQCGAAPRSEDELMRSLAMCEAMASQPQLAYCSHAIRNGQLPMLPDSLMVKAREARRALSSWRTTSSSATAPTRPPTTTTAPAAQSAASATRTQAAAAGSTPQPATKTPPPSLPTAPASAQKPAPKETALSRNPFAVLGATIRDNRQKIVTLAEEKSFDIGDDASQKARAELINPRTRLTAEMAWLPGVSPRRANQLMEQLQSQPTDIWSETGIPSLAQANVMAAAFDLMDPATELRKTGDMCLEQRITSFADLVEALDVDEIIRDINEDRAISGFPEVSQRDSVEAFLSERKTYYRNAVRDGLLERLDPKPLISLVTAAVDLATEGGEDHGPQLVHDLVDAYEVQTQRVLEDEAKNVEQLINVARERAPSGASSVDPVLGKLEQVASNWDALAQPIQLSFKARGKEHGPSEALVRAMRSLAIVLFNQNLIDQATRITELLQKLFAELPEVSELLQEDREALGEIKAKRFVEDEITQLREQAKAGSPVTLDKLLGAIAYWDARARPIRERERSRGEKHEDSEYLAIALRGLSIDLFNDHDLLDQSKQLATILHKTFAADLPEIGQKLKKDCDDLADITKKRGESKVREDQWAKDIAFSAQWGLVFKAKLSLSADGLTYNSQHFPLNAITRVQWGSTKHYTNGVYTGTKYSVTVGDDRSVAVIEPKDEAVFSTFVDKLWRAAGVPIFYRLLEFLKSGREFNFDSATVKDDGIVLPRTHLLKATERILHTWGQVQVYTQNGAFVVESKTDKKARVALSYLHSPNVHVLEHAIRTTFKKGANKLSDLLN